VHAVEPEHLRIAGVLRFLAGVEARRVVTGRLGGPHAPLHGADVLVDDEVITPPLAGTILPGVTRDSALALMRRWGLRVSERQISIDDVVHAHKRGALKEVWGTGTAAVISPVGELLYQHERMVINDGKIGPLTQRLYDAIVGIQYGQAPDPDGWTVEV